MTKRETQLLAEIRNTYPCRMCGAHHYPVMWMTKTREKLVSAGVLETVGCSLLGGVYMALKIAPTC